ncbi:MAG: ornithine carbamoyltransferase [Nitrospinota bacterium]|nr:ornithine carbamoyltransferase [Nitrospinota bacterium]
MKSNIMKKNLVVLSDFTREEILVLFDRTVELKKMRQQGDRHLPLAGKTLGMIFHKHSTRTRISFEVGMFELGGHSLFLTADQLQLKRGETLADSARVLSRYLNAILIRTYDHNDVVQLAQHANIPVINGLTDLSHPVQVLTDIFTIREKLGRIEDVKVAYVGDGNNVAYSWMLGASILGMNLAIAAPPDCRPQTPETMGTRGKVEIMEDPYAAVKDADIVYTDVWVSMGDEDREKEKIKALQNYKISGKLIAAAKENVLVMHCLPAHREQEITSEVLDGKHSIVFDQAENRLHVQKAILEKMLT